VDDHVGDRITNSVEIGTQTQKCDHVCHKHISFHAQRYISRLRNQVSYWKGRCHRPSIHFKTHILSKMHSKAATNNKFAVRWNCKEIETALAIYHKSPAAYRFMRDQLHLGLPAISSLKKRTKHIMQQTGPCPTILASLRQMLLSMRPEDRMATLSLDGMHLTSSLRYEAHRDHYTGFEDVGKQGRTTKIADEGVVVMLRGIHTNWKQPIAHYFCNHSVKQDRFYGIIDECLIAAHNCGVQVVALVCDQETTQWALLKKMVSVEKPYFDHPVTGKSIYVIIDVPHCLKNTRNNLMKYDIEFDSGRPILSFNQLYCCIHSIHFFYRRRNRTQG